MLVSSSQIHTKYDYNENKSDLTDGQTQKTQ